MNTNRHARTHSAEMREEDFCSIDISCGIDDNSINCYIQKEEEYTQPLLRHHSHSLGEQIHLVIWPPQISYDGGKVFLHCAIEVNTTLNKTIQWTPYLLQFD